MLQELPIELMNRRVIDNRHANLGSQDFILLQQIPNGSLEQFLRKLTFEVRDNFNLLHNLACGLFRVFHPGVEHRIERLDQAVLYEVQLLQCNRTVIELPIIHPALG